MPPLFVRRHNARRVGNLERILEQAAALPGRSCGDAIVYQASRKGGGVWPVHRVEGEPGRIAFVDAARRADRLTRDVGGRLALQPMIPVDRRMSQYGVFTVPKREKIVGEAVQTLPAERQGDAAWLMRHFLKLGRTDRDGGSALYLRSAVIGCRGPASRGKRRA